MTTGSSRPEPTRGAALLSAIVVLAALVSVVTAVSVFVASRSTAIVIVRDDVQHLALATSALETGVYRVMTAPFSHALAGKDRIRFVEGEATIDFRAESGRLDLNQASPEWIAALIARLAGPGEPAKALAALIVARRDPTTGKSAQRRSTDLKDLRLGPFAHPAELRALPGMAPHLYQSLLPLVTFYGVSSKIDPRLAPEALLATVPGVSDLTARELARASDLSDDDLATRLSALGSATCCLDTTRSSAIRFKITTRLNNDDRRAYEIVAAIYPDDLEPYRVLYWSEGAVPVGSWSSAGE